MNKICSLKITIFQVSDLSNFFVKKVERSDKCASRYNDLEKSNDTLSLGKIKQAGNGPSRRHIQGSKIAKRLSSVKYFFTVLENRKFFEIFFFEKITY